MRGCGAWNCELRRPLIPMQLVAQYREAGMPFRMQQRERFGVRAHGDHIVRGRVEEGLHVEIDTSILAAGRRIFTTDVEAPRSGG